MKDHSSRIPLPVRMLGAALLLIVGVAGFNYLMNPFGVWSLSLVSMDFTKAQRTRVFPGYAPAIQEPVSMALVGTSRTRGGFRIESMVRDGVLNAGLPAASIEENSAAIGKIAARKDVNTIIWETSFFAFGHPWIWNTEPLTLRRLRGDRLLLISETLFSGMAFKSSFRKLLRRIKGVKESDRRPVPWGLPEIRQEISAQVKGFQPEQFDNKIIVRNYLKAFQGFRLVDDRLQLLRDSVEGARRQGKEVLLFIPPVTEYHLEAIRQAQCWDQYLDWRRQLVKIAPVWDFAGYDELARMMPLFRDPDHFLPAAGWVMYRQMTGEELLHEVDEVGMIARAGKFLTTENVDEMIGKHQQELQRTLDQPSPFRKQVARLRKAQRRAK